MNYINFRTETKSMKYYRYKYRACSFIVDKDVTPSAPSITPLQPKRIRRETINAELKSHYTLLYIDLDEDCGGFRVAFEDLQVSFGGRCFERAASERKLSSSPPFLFNPRSQERRGWRNGMPGARTEMEKRERGLREREGIAGNYFVEL